MSQDNFITITAYEKGEKNHYKPTKTYKHSRNNL